jgi:hypothetical protein
MGNGASLCLFSLVLGTDPRIVSTPNHLSLQISLPLILRKCFVLYSIISEIGSQLSEVAMNFNNLKLTVPLVLGSLLLPLPTTNTSSATPIQNSPSSYWERKVVFSINLVD